MHKRKQRQHGFTLIELIVVIAVVGLLALLSVPKLIGYTQEAHQSRIVNDTKVMEGKVFEHLIKNDDKLPDDFTRLDDISNLETAKLENKLYTFKGLEIKKGG